MEVKQIAVIDREREDQCGQETLAQNTYGGPEDFRLNLGTSGKGIALVNTRAVTRNVESGKQQKGY